MTHLSKLSLCLWLLWASAAAASPRVDCDDPRETHRIQTWLSGVETYLRSRDVSHLTAAQRERRALHLRTLQAYRVAGRFPHNHATRGLTPVFIDPHGTACAVGHLLLRGGAAELAHQIAREHLLARLPELDSPALSGWARENGFTLEELALIQPSYQPDPPVRVCLDSTPSLFGTAQGAWVPLESPIDKLPENVQAGAEFPWLTSAGEDYLWLVSRHGDVQEWLGHTFLKRTRLNYRQLSGAAALPTSSGELLLASAPERASPHMFHQGPARSEGTEKFEDGVQPELFSLWKERGVGTVFGVGRNGGIFQQTPYESWVALTSPTSAPLLSLDGSGPKDLWAVGGGGTALHFDGAEWRQVETRTKEGLIAVKVASPENVWAVGMGGTALHFNGSAWSAIPTGVKSTLRAVAVRGDEVWLGGDDGVILHRRGGTWTREDVPTPASITSFGVVGDTLFAATNAQVPCAAYVLVEAVKRKSFHVGLVVGVLKALHVSSAEGYQWLLLGVMALLAALPLLVLLALGGWRRRDETLGRVCLWLLLLSVPGALGLHWYTARVITFGKGVAPLAVELTRMQDWLLLEYELSPAFLNGGENRRALGASLDVVPRFVQNVNTHTSARDLALHERYARLIATGAASPFWDLSFPQRLNPKTMKDFAREDSNSY